VILRLAVLLNRGRGPLDLPPLEMLTGPRLLELRFPEGWLEANPLTEADLAQEQRWLDACGFVLKFAPLESSQEASAN